MLTEVATPLSGSNRQTSVYEMQMRHKNWLQDKEERQKWMEFMQSFYPDIGLQSIRLLDELGFVSRSIYHLSEHGLEDAGLSFAQYRVLTHLFFAEQMGERSELNPSEISHRQGVSRNTMSSFIRSLEEEGMVERRLDPKDRRRFNISLTETGRDVVKQHMRTHLKHIDERFSSLNDDEQIELLTLLRKLVSEANSESPGS